jgi:hypothetical protein
MSRLEIATTYGISVGKYIAENNLELDLSNILNLILEYSEKCENQLLINNSSEIQTVASVYFDLLREITKLQEGNKV